MNPNGVWFLFFKGRLELVQAHVDEAIEWYNKSCHSQDIWPQFHHICYWVKNSRKIISPLKNS